MVHLGGRRGGRGQRMGEGGLAGGGCGKGPRGEGGAPTATSPRICILLLHPFQLHPVASSRMFAKSYVLHVEDRHGEGGRWQIRSRGEVSAKVNEAFDEERERLMGSL